MSKQTEALKLALEALNRGESQLRWIAIAAIEEALAQPEQPAQPKQEPVVWTKTWFEDGKVVTQHLTAKDIYREPDEEEYLRKAYRLANELRCHLAIAPAPKRPWVGLTDEEIKILWIQHRAALPRYMCFANAVLAKSKEKNT